LLDLLEPGDVWEIAVQGYRKKIWRKIIFLPFAVTAVVYA
jgi:hypothetical protein